MVIFSEILVKMLNRLFTELYFLSKKLKNWLIKC